MKLKIQYLGIHRNIELYVAPTVSMYIFYIVQLWVLVRIMVFKKFNSFLQFKSRAYGYAFHFKYEKSK